MTRQVLVVRLDGMGDVLICGPAVRAVAAQTSVTMLVGPAGADAAQLLPGVERVVVWSCPWISFGAGAVDARDVDDIRAQIAALRIDEAVILTSFHQSALPTALLLRLAGVPKITAISEDFSGALLDIRLAPPPDAPEPERMLAVVQGAGFSLPADDEGLLAVSAVLPNAPGQPQAPYVAVHPGTNAPARTYPLDKFAEVVGALSASGWDVVVTGSDSERELTARAAAGAAGPRRAYDLGGRLRLGELAAVLRDADVVVAANTGPAHLAAAVRTPIVSLFSPVVPAIRWAPYGVPMILLGEQRAACRDTRAVVCPVEGHPCLVSVTPQDVVRAVRDLAPIRAAKREVTA